MLEVQEAFCQLKPVKVLVMGDFLFDVYTKGRVDRISPEAPVPILHVLEISESPGGAGNVALNLQALSAEVSVLGRVGNDKAGGKIEGLLREKGIFTEGLFIDEAFQTPVKNRFLAEGQQLMRSDYEEITPLTEDVEKSVVEYLKTRVSEYDIVAVSDYGKGFLTKKVLDTVFYESRKRGIFVIVDPKGKDFSKYNGAFLIKPNNKEAYMAAGLEMHHPIETVASKLLSEIEVEHFLITRSDKGMALFSKGGRTESFPAIKKEVVDVTGAGDTVLAMITCGLANGLSFANTIALANIAAGLAIEQVGCATVFLSDIAFRLFEKNPEGKIFWRDTNVTILENALKNASLTFLDLNGYNDMTGTLYQKVKRAGEEKAGSKLLVHIEENAGNKELITLLASMQEIDFVLAGKNPFLTRI